MEDMFYVVDDDGQVMFSDNCQLLCQVFDELCVNGVEVEFDGEWIFQCMGMECIFGEYLLLQCLYLFGEVNFIFVWEFVQ